MLASSIEELEVLRKQCKKMVTGRAVASGGVAAVPLPGVDAAADIAMLLQLLPAINEKFGLSPQQLEGLDPECYEVSKKLLESKVSS
ncbi:uncharacterized protein (DUF697 family) [Paenibacillus anaericanus]|uniref:Uncharacterized protein n=1 Tax=Paenibacillus anaericanus TaxID=170367 RepID=A0A3S1K935_9BACL|nr:hypothetical protein [Paenibacillus anaericanus]MDQ0087343.1 uncharacterized protein (DUF697 family) [Paenibacillus anaericanus]RUT46663.1 hypothetical protein EJP82_10470 [Paenibacillus anaericanus]